MDDRLDFHTRRQSGGGPPLLRQAARSAHFDRPLLRPTLGVIDRQHDPAMWVGPRKFLDGPLQGLRFFPIEHSERVVRKSRNGGHGHHDTCKTKRSDCHSRLPLIYELGGIQPLLVRRETLRADGRHITDWPLTGRTSLLITSA